MIPNEANGLQTIEFHMPMRRQRVLGIELRAYQRESKVSANLDAKINLVEV